MKRTPLKRKTALRKVSRKRSSQNQIYSQRRRWFLGMPENSRCPVAEAGLIPDLQGNLTPHWRAATQVHHQKGRVGILFLAEEFWLGVSAEGHTYLHANPAIARERGWTLAK